MRVSHRVQARRGRAKRGMDTIDRGSSRDGSRAPSRRTPTPESGPRASVAELDPLSPPEVHLCGHGRFGQGPRQPRAAVVGLTVGGDAPSLGEYLGAWLSHLKGRVRARTYHGYECLIRLYVKPHLSEMPL